MAFWKFTALRLGLVAVFFVAGLYLQLGLVLSAIVAAVLAWCVTYLFFRDMRDAAAKGLQSRFSEKTPPSRNRAELDDSAAEDSMLDANPDVTIDSDRKLREPKPRDS
ncbi:DUF4229 domain-containing protein [Arthrobacter sp. BL-252-APC-1A]|uniref:DUF4229 domain-containing protein n=1 Tax=Arthrobacter sp. BL-252-APC-1A TaxID=2606622 RepID=UPI0013103493|nr:DUF4229 domain-containing protein [Arthrobacter sp. BL-252-APC-1A]MSR97784.1 DUF4229 domain-containing protein [Arthrobacter sp. BL-252-APC-1A]